MFIAKSCVQEIMGRMDAIAVAEEYLRLEKRGGRYWGRCPFHSGGQERTPSFTVDPDQKLYYCFGCQKGGGIIDFVMEMDKLSYPDALKHLAQKYGISIVYENDSGFNYKGEESSSQKEELYELYRRTALTFNHFLKEKPEGKFALNYLFSRKISIEMIDKFQLGYSIENENWLYGFLQSKGYSEHFLEKSGLFSAYNKGKAFFYNRLMFPIADKQGRISAFGARLMPAKPEAGKTGKEQPKYVNTREIEIYKKGQILYGLNLALPEIRRSKTVYIAEGYFDVIAMHQAGISNTVAPCGTALTDEQAKILSRWADNVILVFDSDEAGQKAAFKGIITCRKNGLSCSLVLPGKSSEGEDFKDPAEILQKFDEKALKNSMNYVIIDIEYLILKGEAQYNISTPRGKTQICEMLFPFIDVLNSASERDDSIGLISDRLHIGKSSVLSDFKQWQHSAKHSAARQPSEEGKREKKLISMNDEMFLLIVVLVNYNLYHEFRALVAMQEIQDSSAKEIFVALEECFINGEAGTEAALTRISSAELRNFIIKRGISPEFKGDQKRDPRKLMEDGINALKIKRFKQRRVEINAELRNKERNIHLINDNELSDLIEEQMYIDTEIKKLEGK